MTCCQRSSVTFKLAVLILMIGIVFNAIGFASPFWSNRSGDYEGLWQICTTGNCVNTVGNNLSNTDWFIANQVLQSVGIVLAVIAAVVAFIFLCSSCVLRCYNACGIVVTIHVFLAGIVIVAGLTLYGVYAVLGNASINFLFSFWLVLVGAVLYFLSGILFSLSVDRDWKHDD